MASDLFYRIVTDIKDISVDLDTKSNSLNKIYDLQFIIPKSLCIAKKTQSDLQL